MDEWNFTFPPFPSVRLLLFLIVQGERIWNRHLFEERREREEFVHIDWPSLARPLQLVDICHFFQPVSWKMMNVCFCTKYFLLFFNLIIWVRRTDWTFSSIDLLRCFAALWRRLSQLWHFGFVQTRFARTVRSAFAWFAFGSVVPSDRLRSHRHRRVDLRRRSDRLLRVGARISIPSRPRKWRTTAKVNPLASPLSL